MTSTKKETHWIPLADLMTVLMVMFLFMTISYMAQVRKREMEQKKPLETYQKLKEEIYIDLNKEFSGVPKSWGLSLDKDLSIKFTNLKVLFQTKQSNIPPEFQDILNSFLPKYLSVVLKEKYKGIISEIRIEGHTDTKPINITSDPYMDNMELSQDRARSVLAFLRSRDCYTTRPPNEKGLLQYWLTANGFSYGRTLDKNFKSTYESHLPIDDEKSRRVEFKIVTNSDSTINQSLNNNPTK